MNKPKQFPQHAERVYASPEFDVWQWPQKMFDGSTKIFRRVVQMGGASIIASTKNKVILLKQKQPGTPWYYCLPGGSLDDPKETPRQTARRELLEETGYEPGTMKLWKNITKLGRLYHERFVFIARDCKKIASPSSDAGEKIEVLLVTFEQLLKFTDHPQFFHGDMYKELLKARADKNYKKSLKQALFGKKPNKTR